MLSKWCGRSPSAPRSQKMTATILTWALFGLLLGAVECCQGRQALRVAEKIGVGILGAFLGGLVGWGLGISPSNEQLSMAGMQPTAAVLLAVIAALLFAARRSGPASGPAG